ncbi:endonuclease domain-containing protein [Candidatus Margulisiibacteriota bacterium]
MQGNGFSTKEMVRYLRKNQTNAEIIIWEKLRNRQVDGYKFIRQYPIIIDEEKSSNYIADFYCSKKKLIIEIDSPIHNKQREYDEYREEGLTEMNYDILRFRNEEIENNLKQVLTKIKNHLNK